MLKIFVAEALPGAVGIFADALYGDGTKGSGDKARLFKDMEDGKLKLEELVKVIDYMKTLTEQDLLDRMLNTPARKFVAMKNQLILALEAINDAGVLDLMINAFQEMAKGLAVVAKVVKENKAVFEGVGEAFSVIYKSIKLVGEAIYNNEAAFWGIVAALVAMNIPAIITAGTFVAIAAAVGVLILAVADLQETLEGKDTFFKEWSESENPFIRFLAKSVILLGEMVSLLSKIDGSKLMEMMGYLFKPMGIQRAIKDYAFGDKSVVSSEDKGLFDEKVNYWLSRGAGGVLDELANSNINSRMVGMTPMGLANMSVAGAGAPALGSSQPIQQTNYVQVTVSKPNAVNADVTNSMIKELSNLPMRK